MNNILYKGDANIVLENIKDKYKVDMIYIDPPYNTNRKNMTYDDNRSDEEFTNLLINTISKSYNMLKDTGNIFVSISGKNLHIVRNVLDKIFSKNNYEATMIRIENAKKQKIGKVSLKENYEYVVVYCKNKSKKQMYYIQDEKYIQYKKNLIKLKDIIEKNNENVNINNENVNGEILNREYITDYIDLKENIKHIKDIKVLKILKNIWNIQESKQGLKQYKYIYNNNVYRAADINMYVGKWNSYQLIHPITKKVCKSPKYNYPNIETFSKEWILNDNILNYTGEIINISNDKILCGNIILGINENKIPDYANLLDENVVPDTIINITGSDDRKLTKLFENNKVFDYPKPTELLEYLISIATKENDTVLDFFAGSGTTGEAASNLNRNFILIQKDELIEEITLSNTKINHIYDITKERLNRSNVKFIET